MNEIEMLKQLHEQLRREFSAKGICEIAPARLKQIDPSMEIVRGMFVDNNGIACNHNWNRKGNKNYDITAGQFKGFPDIYITEVGSEEAKRYIEGIQVAF